MRGMTSKLALAGAIALSLAACGKKSVSAQNVTGEEVAARVKESGLADAEFIKPGRWQTSMTITEMKIPGIPPEMAKRMQAGLGEARSFFHCVTEADAKKPKPDFFSGDRGASCTYDSFNMTEGKISMAMQCSHGPSKHRMTMNGTYSSEAYHMDMHSEVEGGAPAGSPMAGMTMSATLDAKRVGECTGKDER